MLMKPVKYAIKNVYVKQRHCLLFAGDKTNPRVYVWNEMRIAFNVCQIEEIEFSSGKKKQKSHTHILPIYFVKSDHFQSFHPSNLKYTVPHASAAMTC